MSFGRRIVELGITRQPASSAPTSAICHSGIFGSITTTGSPGAHAEAAQQVREAVRRARDVGVGEAPLGAVRAAPEQRRAGRLAREAIHHVACRS